MAFQSQTAILTPALLFVVIFAARPGAAVPYVRPTIRTSSTANTAADWLLQPDPRLSPATVELKQLDNQTIAITNGLVSWIQA